MRTSWILIPTFPGSYWTSRTKGREFRRQSLLDEFSISEIWIGSRPETGCVSAETGSTSRRRALQQYVAPPTAGVCGTGPSSLPSRTCACSTRPELLMRGYRAWLAQLPADQARNVAHANAERLFGGKVGE